MFFIDTLLLILPVVSVLGVILLACSLAKIYNQTTTPHLLPSGKIPLGCPDRVADGKCSIKTIPAMGGVDFVEYFTAYKLADGTYNESSDGRIGRPGINSSYNGYTFRFTSDANRNIFVTNPTLYLPQYGGFCAWAVAGEIEGYPWSEHCMGPSGNKAVWAMIGDKLYFFKVESAKYNFMTNPSKYVDVGDERWNSWFGNRNDYFDTNCTLYNT